MILLILLAPMTFYFAPSHIGEESDGKNKKKRIALGNEPGSMWPRSSCQTTVVGTSPTGTSPTIYIALHD